MNKKLLLACVLASGIMFSGCATLVGGGGTQSLSINSNKAVKGKLNYEGGDEEDALHFTTPATLKIDRSSKDIIITSENNEFHEARVESGINGWFFGNLITGGLLGSTTDSASGAAWKYDKQVNVSVAE